MLTKIEFENFKSWKSASVDLAPITAIFGVNSSGKTSLLQFPLLLKQTKDQRDRTIPITVEGSQLNLGCITDVMHRHDTRKHLRWRVSMKLDSELVLQDTTMKGKNIITRVRELDVESEIGIRHSAPFSLGIGYVFNDHRFELRPANQSTQPPEVFEMVYRAPKNGKASPSPKLYELKSLKRESGRARPIPAPINSFAFPDQVRSHFTNTGFLADLEVAYVTQMDKIYYLGPLREFPGRYYFGSGPRPSDVGKSGEHTISAIIAATHDKERRRLCEHSESMSFQEMVAHWLRQMGLLQEFRVSEVAPHSQTWQIPVKVNAGSREVLLPDVGFGVSQVLPVITLLQYVPEGSTVLLDKPELHLHPLAQAELADLIIHAATQRKVQVILESQSEQFLLRLQRRIAEETLPAEKTKLYYCEMPDKESRLQELQIDEFGRISNWPNKFMGDAFNETADALIAALERKQKHDDGQ